MTASMTEVPAAVRASVGRFVAFLEVGATEGLFAPDVFADITLPHWRGQGQGAAQTIAPEKPLPPPARRARGGKGMPPAPGPPPPVGEGGGDPGARGGGRGGV